MSVRTFAWIARQPYNIRYVDDGSVLSDDSMASERFMQTYPSVKEPYDQLFKRGFLWPSLVLVENAFEKDTKLETYFRLYKTNMDAIVDFYIGDDMDKVTDLATKFDIPIYRVTNSRKGKRGSVQKILDFHD